MKVLLFLASSLALCLGNVSITKLFRAYATGDGDGTMELAEFTKYWNHFDVNGDGNITKFEFDYTWKEEDLGDEDRAPYFFLEMDRVPDEVLTDEDFAHMFHIFDENGNGHITKDEF